LVTPIWKALQPRRGKPPRFGLLPVRSPLLRESSFLSFPPVTEMFQFTGLASTRLWIQRRNIRASRDQRSFVNSPGLIADFHALHRLLMPRHPPCALISLTTNIHCSQTLASPLQVALFSFIPLLPNFRRTQRIIHPKMPSTHEQLNCQRSYAGSHRAPVGLAAAGIPEGKAEFSFRAATCQRPMARFSNFFFEIRKTTASPFHRPPASESLTR
jgi:hypothetical protein